MKKQSNTPLSHPIHRRPFKLALKSRVESGFALIATISVMALVIMIAMAMVSLSTSVTRTSQHGKAMEEAQANARMALMMAIGKLQQEMGPDMRISAPADIVDPANPSLVGVWRSWEGSDHEDNTHLLVGRPKAPDYSSKADSYKTSADGRFVSWLVSGGSATDFLGNAATLVLSSPSADTIPLLASGSLASDDIREVHVIPSVVNDAGAFAWWVSGENQKARIPRPYAPTESVDPAILTERNSSHAGADPSVFGLDSLLADNSLSENIITLNTSEFIADDGSKPDDGTEPHKSFHDLTVNSVGLLTNVATGGWRKDLSLLTEKWEEQPYEGLELFQLAPGAHQPYTRPKAVALADTSLPIPIWHKEPGSVFYPWSNYIHPTDLLGDGQAGGNWPREHFHNRAAVTSWASLADFATFYKKIDNVDGGIPSINQPYSWFFTSSLAEPLNSYHGLHSTWVVPHIAKIQMIYSHYATDFDFSPNLTGLDGNLRPAVLITPVVTLWNPYNFEIKFPTTEALKIKIGWSHPVALNYKGQGTKYWGVQRGNYGGNLAVDENYNYKDRMLTKNWQLKMAFPGNQKTPDGRPALTLGPGETRVFSPLPKSNTLKRPTEIKYDQGASYELVMRPGLLHDDRYLGWYIGLDKMIAPGFVASGSTKEEINQQKADTYTKPPTFELDVMSRYDLMSSEGYCGPNLQWGIPKIPHGNLNAVYHISEAADTDSYYPPSTDSFPVALNEIVRLPTAAEPNPYPIATPFMSLVFGSRIASHKATPTKGVVQANPAMKSSNFRFNGFTPSDYPGVSSATNSSWEYSYIYHTKGGASLPDAGAGDASGFIITGDNVVDGIDRVVMIDLPTRPLTSLAQLSSWFIKGLNPLPPQTHDVIGNSDATPLIPMNNVVDPDNNPYSGIRENEQQDDSYCSNHLLFDDWFFSSIAPEPDTIGPIGQDLMKNYTDFLTGIDPLANRTYKPIFEDRAANSTIADNTYMAQVDPVDSWKTIASRLEVEGMFNVNSTSVKAWRALLGHARNQKIPYLEDTGVVKLSGEIDYAFPRSLISGHGKAGELPTNGVLKESYEFAGYRVFTSDMLDKLAKNIVTQVRRRGPFLSLSEFVNRQLSSDEDLAVGGAIQVALNQLAADPDPALNPFDVMQAASRPSVSDPPSNHEYVFGKAAEGHNTYGLPGWTRQADILRSLAPILSARDDTFTIRAYGDSRDKSGKVIARAWCEAVVRRTRDYIDSSDSPDITTLPNDTNKEFGRRFKLSSFRWLNPDEV